jgi:hypothetical protein
MDDHLSALADTIAASVVNVTGDVKRRAYEILCRAVGEERERCARIVDSGICGCPPPGCYDAVCSLNKMAELIRGT